VLLKIELNNNIYYNYKIMFEKLPIELVQYIYEFCIDKRIHWDKVTEQFLKGGFNRKNLNIFPFIEKQKKLCRRFWLSTRPEIYGITQWNTITRTYDLCPFDYRYGEWDIKKKYVVVTFERRNGFRNRWSSKDPVSKWLKNINKFETAALNWHCSYAPPLGYLPKEKNNFGIKFNTQFYKNRAEKNKKKKKKEEDKKKSDLFIKERKDLKIKSCPFINNYAVLLSFITQTTKKIYKGNVTRIWLKEHRNDNGRLIFTKPRGKNSFDPNTVDNYIGQIKITVRFEDGEYRYYTTEKLLRRIKISKLEETAAIEKKKRLENNIKIWELNQEDKIAMMNSQLHY